MKNQIKNLFNIITDNLIAFGVGLVLFTGVVGVYAWVPGDQKTAGDPFTFEEFNEISTYLHTLEGGTGGESLWEFAFEYGGNKFIQPTSPNNSIVTKGISSGDTNSVLLGPSLLVSGSITASDFIYSSDRSLKENIEPLENALDQILVLSGVSFNWKSNNSEANLGLIAQDVEKVYPELVVTDPSTGLKSVKYGNLVAPLIEAIKEQQEQIEDLEARITALESRL